MKRLWIGIGFLVLLLTLGVTVGMTLTSLQDSISQTMEEAAQAALAEDFPTAYALADQAQALWQRQRHFAAAFTDHEPLEQMDSYFAELNIYRVKGDAPDFAAICALLAEQSRAVGESHGFSWWSFL